MPTSGSQQFDVLKQHLDSDGAVRREVEFALSALLARANPSNRANRFVYGNGVEWIIACAAWSAGVLTSPAGHDANGFDLADLLDDAKGLWSVKASASGKATQVRLINFMGTGEGARWEEPTLFVSPFLEGAVLVVPGVHRDIADLASHGHDALTLRPADLRAIKEFSTAHPENRIALDVAANRGDAPTQDSDFIQTILLPSVFPHLSKPFAAAQPVGAGSIVDEITGLTTLRAKGDLTEDEFQKAVRRVIAGP